MIKIVREKNQELKLYWNITSMYSDEEFCQELTKFGQEKPVANNPKRIYKLSNGYIVNIDYTEATGLGSCHPPRDWKSAY